MTERPAQRGINTQYPSSWWGLGFSHEVRQGEIVPIKFLERDLILWRDSEGVLHCQGARCPHLGANIGYGGTVVDGNVRCPFHGYQYSKDGALVRRDGERVRATARRLCLQTYQVRERFGGIYIWNGSDAPDHDLPGLTELFPDSPNASEGDYDAYHFAFYLPFPAKWFVENVADANHFGALHRACDWGETDTVVESPHRIRSRLRLINPVKVPSLEYFRDLARTGQLTKPSVVGNGLDITTYGGGFHVVLVDSFTTSEGANTNANRLMNFLAATRAIMCWTPVTEGAHWAGTTVILPKTRWPVPARLRRTMIEYLGAMRTWGPTIQDYAVMSRRLEPTGPAYGQLDRGLITFRRFWDSRVEDEALGQGDTVHTNGARAGIRRRPLSTVDGTTSNVEVAR